MKKEIIFKKLINLEEKEFYIVNTTILESLELEYFKNVGLYCEKILVLKMKTNEELPRVIEVKFEILENGEFTSHISVETENFYKVEGALNIEGNKLKAIFEKLYKEINLNFDFEESLLINEVCIKAINYTLNRESKIKFYNEENRLKILNRNLNLYIKSIESPHNEMTELLEEIEMIMSTEAIACWGHMYDVNIARPFGPSLHIQEQIENINKLLLEYNDIFKDVLNGKTFLEYMANNSDRFVEIYTKMTTVYGDNNESSHINYLTLSSEGVYLINRLNYKNKENLNVRDFIDNNKYSCLVDEVKFEASLNTFDCFSYPIYHIGNKRDDYIELHIKETNKSYYIKTCFNNKLLYDFKVPKEDLNDKVIVFSREGFMLSDKVILVDDKTFEFNSLNIPFAEPIGFDDTPFSDSFDDLTEYYNNKEDTKRVYLQSLESSLYERKYETNHKEYLDDEEIPF